MCFSPQRRTILRHQNFQKCFKHLMFCAFSVPNVLFATAACNFWFLLWAATSAPAALTGLLFDWPDTRIIEKTQHFATSLTFGADVSSFFWLSRYCIFCRLTWLLYYCFSTLHIVGSFYLNFLRLCLQLHLNTTMYWCVKLICQLPCMHQTAPPNSSWVQTMQCKCQLMIQPSFHDNSSPQTPVCQNPTEQISNINPTRDMHLQWTSSFCLLTYYVCTCTWWIELCTAHITHSSDHIFPQTARCPPSSCPHHTHQHSAPSPGALASARPANRQLKPTAVLPEPPR